MGNYTGNGSSNGPFIFTGFQVAWLMVKSTAASTNWRMYNNLMPAYNSETGIFYANTNTAQNSTGHPFDFHSNGAKVREAGKI